MNDYTKDLIDRLLKIDGNGELISETIIHIRDLVAACKEGWRYTDELDKERLHLLNELNIVACDLNRK